MTLTVTPQPDNVPPRVRIEIDSGDPSKSFTSLTVFRDGKAIRQQPYIGGATAITYDYEARFGTAMTYTAEGSIASFTTALAGSWASLTGWTTASGTPTTTAGYLTTSGPGEASVYRTDGSSAARRMTILTNPGYGGMLQVGPVAIGFNTGFVSASYFGGDYEGVTWSLGSAVLAWDESELTFSTGQETLVIPRGNAPGGFTTLVTARVFPGDKVPPFTLLTPALEPFSNSATAVLDVSEAWLIHPTFTALSVSVDPGQHKFRDAGINVARTTKTSVSRAAKASRHDPVGSESAVIFTSGPRSAGEWDLVLRTRRLQDRDSVTSICRDQSSLLLRTPAGWAWDLPDGWYSIADTEESRPRDGLHHEDREITLPLTPARDPAVRLAASWTFASDLLRNPTFADSRNEFPTFLDRLTGP